jgi:hypothetical protein
MLVKIGPIYKWQHLCRIGLLCAETHLFFSQQELKALSTFSEETSALLSSDFGPGFQSGVDNIKDEKDFADTPHQ